VLFRGSELQLRHAARPIEWALAPEDRRSPREFEIGQHHPKAHPSARGFRQRKSVQTKKSQLVPISTLKRDLVVDHLKEAAAS